jgi:hypothetical protein
MLGLASLLNASEENLYPDTPPPVATADPQNMSWNDIIRLAFNPDNLASATQLAHQKLYSKNLDALSANEFWSAVGCFQFMRQFDVAAMLVKNRVNSHKEELPVVLDHLAVFQNEPEYAEDLLLKSIGAEDRDTLTWEQISKLRDLGNQQAHDFSNKLSLEKMGKPGTNVMDIPWREILQITDPNTKEQFTAARIDAAIDSWKKTRLFPFDETLDILQARNPSQASELRHKILEEKGGAKDDASILIG